jgi:hypothetical protein
MVTENMKCAAPKQKGAASFFSRVFNPHGNRIILKAQKMKWVMPWHDPTT